MRVAMVLVSSVCLCCALAGCLPGQAGLLLSVVRGFRAAGCQGLPPEDRPIFAEVDCSGNTPCASGPIRVMTYNILCSICVNPDYDSWWVRLPHLREMLAQYAPDIAGLQELSSVYSVVDVLADAPEYGVLTYAPGVLTYADATIIYRRDRFEVVESGHYWLSELPCSFPSGDLGSKMMRYVNWAHMRERNTGFQFLFISTHFDADKANRQKSAHVLTEWLAPLVGHVPMIVVGDFNCGPDSVGYATLQGGNGAAMRLENTWDVAVGRLAPPAEAPLDEAAFLATEKPIDHIFYAGPAVVTVDRWMRDKTTYGPNERAPSDHYPIIADLELTMP
ncbi:MAG TPA: endonuclease/exonuclease/phosphatase family protein [Candidatus Hydrogenedentes bacterium]|nr:endonuclease/exonuclease/phosphatase family protein [Candidatus Hydrogenedentota bacterium]HPG65740.1 endonuclease/exonuclease/phosphatase family protein [Candidatus Hydrogenedentota bacterium]